MSSSFVKTKLKAARDALTKKDFATAQENASSVLEYEPENYNALVFLALAQLELGQNEDSEKTYRRATDLQPKQALAWQGLAKFYERTENREQHAEVLRSLLDIYNEGQDAVKCAETLQKYVEDKRQIGGKLQIVDALNLYLPGSPYHELLSTLPAPDPTKPTATTTSDAQSAIHNSLQVLQEVVQLTEEAETRTFDQEFQKRRLRLNAPSPEQLKKDIGIEVFGSSKLPVFYNELLNHPNTSDEDRRLIEGKLLRRKIQYLHALPMSDEKKSAIAKEVSQMADDVVLLGIADELAWKFYMDHQDIELLEDYDHNVFSKYIRLFPETPLTSFFKGYLYTYKPSHLEGEEETPPDDPFELMMDAYTSLQNVIFPTLVVADIYLQDHDYQNSAKLAEIGLELVRKIELNDSTRLPQVVKAFRVILSTSLVHHQPPKHHRQALTSIKEVLAMDPDNIPCLLGQAYIMQASEKWEEAGTVFSRVHALIPDDPVDGLRSREESAWCKTRYQGPDSAMDELNEVSNLLEELDDREHDQARCLWRCGQLLREYGKNEESYRLFISCLKKDPAFAAAFTSLGFYYLESSPPDSARASKCFQKAFELDPTETKAAQQLCQGFAQEQDWELVEVVAKRTIDGEGGNDGGSQATGAKETSQHQPVNVWAWRAMGIVELVNRNYPSAIQSFQVALRANPSDAVSWLRLGEAYSRAGKHAAALKALRKSQEIDSQDWLCDYFIGDVQRQLGQYEEAINSFRTILGIKSAEVGTLALLAQTYLELGRSEFSTNFTARAEYSFTCCIRESLQLIKHHSGFSSLAWKLVGDALTSLAERTSFYDVEALGALLAEITALIPSGSERISALTGSSTNVDGATALRLSLLAYDHRLSLGFSDTCVAASAWHDMGIALHSWSSRSSEGQDVSGAEKEALKCIIEALRIDSGSDANWTALGSMKFVSEPKVAQHAFIMALEIDNKNVETWTSLGLLYLYHGDIELARQMFSRAQILDPDYTLTWIGQALVASASQSDQEADLLFEHAATLTASIPSVDLNFANRSFVKLLRNATPGGFYPMFLALSRYIACKPDDPTALNLLALVAERLGHLEFATSLMEKAISLLEAAYEELEDSKIERQFTIANCNFARMLLSCGRSEEALDAFAAVLGLLDELEDGDTVGYVTKAQAQIGSALIHQQAGDGAEAVRCLEEALVFAGKADSSSFKSRVIVLLGKILWSTGTEEAREQAKSLLLERIAEDAEDIAAIQTLAGMGILSMDHALVDAALAEIISLPIDQRHELDPERELDYLLKQYNLAQGDVPQALSVLQSATHAEPQQSSNRAELAKLLVQLNQKDAAAAVLGRSDNGAEALKAMCARDPEKALRLAQAGVMLRPGQIDTWRGLAVACAASQS